MDKCIGFSFSLSEGCLYLVHFHRFLYDCRHPPSFWARKIFPVIIQVSFLCPNVHNHHVRPKWLFVYMFWEVQIDLSQNHDFQLNFMIQVFLRNKSCLYLSNTLILEGSPSLQVYCRCFPHLIQLQDQCPHLHLVP